LEQHTSLGSGFNIAMKDLEIRGAGDLLGGEQSGFINEMGFETYQKILNETIADLKQNEFKDLFVNENKIKNYISEVSIDTDLELLFPDYYIKSVNERLRLYTELNKLKNLDQLIRFEEMLKDRFGELPKEVNELLITVQIKWLGIEFGFEKIVMRKNLLKAYFISNSKSDYYETETFLSVLNFVNNHPDICKLQEKKTKNETKLILYIYQIQSVNKALSVLKLIKS
jgi:transcription-repair coupling factor (superfamily II helicase)